CSCGHTGLATWEGSAMVEDDPYSSGICRWWHCSESTPELVQAVADGWLGTPGRVLDLGCGLGMELAYLSVLGFSGVGIDMSAVALHQAHAQHPAVSFLRADVLQLPVASASCDGLIDRGCFHYLTTSSARSRYAAEASRVLRPGGRFFLRACLLSAGVRNGLDETTLQETFAGWQRLMLASAPISSDTRFMPALIGLFERRV
ncbi:MAG: class I SAM-dependent methyltransferase, partial [Dehalococcoidia bacterium]